MVNFNKPVFALLWKRLIAKSGDRNEWYTFYGIYLFGIFIGVVIND